MLIARPLNINTMYENGFDAVLLNRQWHDRLMKHVNAEQWVEDDEGLFLSRPAWTINPHSEKQAKKLKIDEETDRNDFLMRTAPPDLMASANALLECSDIMGIWQHAYQAKMKFLTMWNGAEDLDWHWDGPAQADFFFLIYLNRFSGWSDKMGGQLITGIRDIDRDYLKVDKSRVRTLSVIDPISRTLVCCNNQNPRFVHKVVPLDEGKERIVLMIGFDLVPIMKGEQTNLKA